MIKVQVFADCSYRSGISIPEMPSFSALLWIIANSIVQKSGLSIPISGVGVGAGIFVGMEPPDLGAISTEAVFTADGRVTSDRARSLLIPEAINIQVIMTMISRTTP